MDTPGTTIVFMVIDRDLTNLLSVLPPPGSAAWLGLAAPPQAPFGRDDPAVGRHDDLRAGSLCRRGHLCAAGVAHIPHLHRADDD